MSFLSCGARGRIAALTLLTLLIVAVWAGPVAAYLRFVDAGAEDIARKAQLLQRYRALADAPPATGQPEEGFAPSLMLPGLPEAQALGLLQEAVKKAASAAHVEVNSLLVLRSETLPNALRIAVRINAAGDMAGLGRLLYAAETARPVLYPDNLQIRSRNGAPGKAPETLDFQLDLSGFAPGSAQ